MPLKEYADAIRSSIKTVTHYFKRNSKEICVNNFIYDILTLLKANMDIRYILDAYAVASYIINYLSKVNNESSKIVRQISLDWDSNTTTFKTQLQNIARSFLNFTTIGAQEAVFIILGLPMYKSSRKCEFINTNKKANRVKLRMRLR